MEALLPVLLACLIVESTGPAALLSRALAQRFASANQLAAGFIIAAAANAALAFSAAALLQSTMGSGARALFLSLALLFAGIGMVVPVKVPDSLGGWSIGPFATSALGLFILGFGDAAQFLIVALILWGGGGMLTAIGGGIGIILGCVAGTMGLTEWRFLPLARRIAGGAFCLLGSWMALAPLGIG